MVDAGRGGGGRVLGGHSSICMTAAARRLRLSTIAHQVAAAAGAAWSVLRHLLLWGEEAAELQSADLPPVDAAVQLPGRTACCSADRGRGETLRCTRRSQWQQRLQQRWLRGCCVLAQGGETMEKGPARFLGVSPLTAGARLKSGRLRHLDAAVQTVQGCRPAAQLELAVCLADDIHGATAMLRPVGAAEVDVFEPTCQTIRPTPRPHRRHALSLVGSH